MPDGPHESPFGEPLRLPVSRWGEPHKMVPVVFILSTIGMLYLIYVFGHCLPLMRREDDDARYRGFVELISFNVISFLLLLSYAQCTLVHPGEVPREWIFIPDQEATHLPTVEKKKKDGGAPRHCKKCGKYKPDRCHHCKVCGMCILKMDHHCPWINNCVGHHNYKFFMLLLFYTMLTTHFIFWTSSESMIASVTQNADFLMMFFVLFGLTISLILATMSTIFLGFHIWLVAQGLSTIEFCEQVLPQAGPVSCWCLLETDSMWDLGVFRNLQQVLGESPLFWLLPISTTMGTGLAYEPAEGFGMPSARDLEVGRGRSSRGNSRQSLKPLGYGAVPKTFEPSVQHNYQRQPYWMPT